MSDGDDAAGAPGAAVRPGPGGAAGGGGGTPDGAARPGPAPRPSPLSRPGLFLARDTYRQRRLRDAARMLPVLGAVVWLIPLMWRHDPGPAALAQADAAQGGGTAAAVVFLFTGWVLLIVLAAVIARRLRPERDATTDPDAPA